MELMVLRAGVIERDGTGEPVAVISEANILREVAPCWSAEASSRVVAWSGWSGESAEPALGVFPREVATWGPAAWAALAAVCDRMVPRLVELGGELCLRPHARHVLSDPQRCLTFLRSRENQPIRLLLEPAAFLTVGMLAAAEDHMDRALSALAGQPGTWAVLLSNVRRLEAEGDPDQLAPAALDEGLLDPEMMLRVWRKHAPEDQPCVVLPGDIRARAAVLGRG
jgi:hypothetical protein